MTGRGMRPHSGRAGRLRKRGRGRGRIIRGSRGIRGFRGGHVRQRGDFGPTATVNRNEGRERDYIDENSYSQKHYSERYDESKYYRYRSRSRSRSLSRSSSRTRSRMRSRSPSRSPYRRLSHDEHYPRSRSKSRRRSRSFSRSVSRSPPRYRAPRHESSSERIPNSLRKHEEEIRRREQVDKSQKRPMDRHPKPFKKDQMNEQFKAVKEQVKAAKERVKVVKEQFKKTTPLPEIVKEESPSPPVKVPSILPVTVRDMPIYSDESSDEFDSIFPTSQVKKEKRFTTTQAKKGERFQFETDVGKDIRSQLLERAMIEKKKLGLENPGAAEKSSALEALQCYSPETHSPSPTSQHNYDIINVPSKKITKKRKTATKKDTLKSSFKSNDNKTESLPPIPGLGFCSIEDEEIFLYGNEDEKDEDKDIGDEEEEEEDDDDDNNIGIDQAIISVQSERKMNVIAQTIPKTAVKASLVETKDCSSNQINFPFQDIPLKRRRLLTSESDNATEYARGEVVPNPYAGSTMSSEIMERKYSALDMIDLQFSEKLRKDSPSQFSKSSLSPPVKNAAEKGSRSEFTSQYDVKPPFVTRKRKDSLEERHLMHQSPSGDYERKYNKTEKYFHPVLSGERSKREDSPRRKELTPRYRHELFEETERKHRQRNRKAENFRSEDRSRNWETSPRNRSFDRSPDEKRKWEDYRDFARSPRKLSLERGSCHSRSPRESYYDRSPSNSPRRWSSPRREVSPGRWSPRQDSSPREGDNSNDRNTDWLQASHRDRYCDRRPSPSRSPDGTQSSSPNWNKEYENSFQKQSLQSFDMPSSEPYATSQHLPCASTDNTEAAPSYSIPQQDYYQSVGSYPAVNQHMAYTSYNTAFPQPASFSAPFPPYVTMPPNIIQVSQQPLTRTQEPVTRTNLTVIPLQNEIKPRETKYNFLPSEDERRRNETSKHTFVTISDNDRLESNQVPSIDYSAFSYKELLDKRADKKKHLTLLQREMAKLCKMQGELMRKKQKEKDGHKDALIVENTKLQEEVANQIQESKRELLQINLAIRKCLEETERKKEMERQEKQEKKIQELRREELEKEQNQRTRYKHQSEERMEEAIDDPLGSGTHFNFKYFDPGNHWCRPCNQVNPSIFKLFEHLHSSKHKEKIDPCDRPWVTLNQKRESEKSLGSQTIAAPIKGVQFLVPLEGFYCSICKEILPDAVSTEEHLKSTSHNRSYTKYILLNPFYERRWNLDKAAGIAAAEREEKKRQKALSLEAKNRKREEAERQHKEFIKNEKAKEMKRLHDIPPPPLSNNKAFESYTEKDVSKPKPKAIRLTLLGDKSKFTKQRKEDKTPPSKETKSVPVIYIGKAPNFRSMAHKQDTSGFGKFNWKKDENEIVPEDQVPDSEEFMVKQEDQSSKAEEAEQKEKLRNFPLRKSKKPQINLVYGPEPPPDLQLRESQQAPPSPEKGDGVLPSEIDIAQAFAGKFEGNESSTVSKNQHSSAVNKETFLIIDETSSPKHETLEEEVKPTATVKENASSGPSRQMMLMLKSVENMSKEAKSNLPGSAYKSHSLPTKPENSHLINKPIVTVGRNVSIIQPMQMTTALRPPGEEDIFVTENINVKPPPPLKPQIGNSLSSESFTGNTNVSSAWSETVNKPTKVVVGNVNNTTTEAAMGNVSRPSLSVVGNANKPITSIAVSETKFSVTTVGNVMDVGNKANLTEAENLNKATFANETIKQPETKENESRPFPIMAGNVARIQPQQINISKSEDVSLVFTKTLERNKSEVMPISQTPTYQEGMSSTGSTTCMVSVTRPKVQIISSTIKKTETESMLELQEDMQEENELPTKSMTDVVELPPKCVADAMISKEHLLNLSSKTPSHPTFVDELCDAKENELLKNKETGVQCGLQAQSRDMALNLKRNCLGVGEDNCPSATEKISEMTPDEVKMDAISSLISQEEKKGTCISSCEASNQSMNNVDATNSLIQEQLFEAGAPCKSTDDINGSTTQIDSLAVSVDENLQRKCETNCRSAKEENVREDLPESLQTTTELKAVCADLVEMKNFHLDWNPSDDNGPRLNTDGNISQNKVSENSDNKPSISFDSEASASNSSLLLTEFPRHIDAETMHKQNINDSLNIVGTTGRQTDIDNEAEQIVGKILCCDKGETCEKDETSSDICEMSFEDGGEKEQGNTVAVENSDNNLNCELKPSCKNEKLACEADSEGSLEKGISEQASCCDENVDTDMKTEANSMLCSTETVNPDSVCVEEKMETDFDNPFYSNDKTKCIESRYSDATERFSEQDISQSINEKQGKMSFDSAAESGDISFGKKTNASKPTAETVESTAAGSDLNFHSVSTSNVIEDVTEGSLEQTLHGERQKENRSINAEPCSFPCDKEIIAGIRLEEAQSSVVDDRSEQQIPAESLDDKNAEGMEIDSGLNFKGKMHCLIQPSPPSEAVVTGNISAKNLEPEKAEQNLFDLGKADINADSCNLPIEEKGLLNTNVCIHIEKGSPIDNKSEKQIFVELDDDRSKYNAKISERIALDEASSHAVQFASISSENETSDIAGKNIDISKDLPLDLSEKVKHNTEREPDLVVNADTAALTVTRNTATEREVSMCKSEQLSKIDITCPQPNPGYPCDEEALNLNEDTVEFCESPSPREQVHSSGGANGVSMLQNLVTFPETGTHKCEAILSFDSDKENTELSFDNAGEGTSANSTSQNIDNGTEMSSILSSNELDVVTDTNPQEETTNKLEDTRLAMSVGFSPTQHTEVKAGPSSQQTKERHGCYCEEKTTGSEEKSGDTFAIDDADATIQALESLLEETKQLQSPAAKSFESKEVAVLAEENVNADVKQKNE